MSKHKEPPIVQVEDNWDEATRTLSYSYAGRLLISMVIPGEHEPSYRRDSDGTLNSIPLIEQIYVMLKEEVTAEVTFYLTHEAVNMRPRRAISEQAILGQIGRPLLRDVNGLYDMTEDYMLSWYGRPWQWLSDKFETDADGNLVARMQVKMGKSAWFINFKPQFYRTHHGYKYHEPWKYRPRLEPISGWCSWEAHRRNIDQDRVDEAAQFCGKHFKPYGMTYIQIDDGFQKMPLPANPDKPIPDAWLNIDDEKFPKGHAGIVESIRKEGMEPGIWTSVSIYNDEFPKHQAHCLVKDDKGVPILGDWIKYLIDCTPETLKEQVVPYYKQLAEYGYTYFKTDVTRHLLFDGFHKAVEAGTMTWQEAEEKYRAFMEAAREAMGDKPFWLLSWGVMMEGAGTVDACRISMDALPTWSGLRMQIIESARWWHTHRVVWQNDPDHICMRANLEWARSVLSTVSLTGGLFMLSDSIDKYDEDRVYMIQRCLPPLPTVTAETGPLQDDYAAFTWTKFHGFGVLDDPPYEAEDMSEEEARDMAGWSETMDDNHPLGSLWSFHLDTDAGRWCVALRAAVLPLKESSLSLSKLGLNEHREYIAFDFWKQQYLGKATGTLACEALRVGHCQVIALREVSDHPQLISSSRHISQDAVSVKKQQWNDGLLTLSLDGVPGTTETYWFHVPAGATITAAEGDGLTAELGELADECLAVSVTFKSQDAVLRLN
ncbi:MAG: alpha-galactosidase [Kiritimatiellia bacterium]|jgi:hypothetical protein|nr:alpha-galactosidase [Kiritimatiellia bacterium]